MDYIGEQLFPGQLGQFFIIVSLVASLVATIAFYQANKTAIADRSWLKMARIAFFIETIAVLAVFVLLYYIISNHLFEFKYAWQHSDRSLQTEYLLSCFWEGQEGSFMLWSFWHCVLGWVIIWKGHKWEAGVMMVVSFAQFTLATMILGIYFFGYKVGSSPFVLTRNELDAPIFSRPDYLNLLKDGNGLNTLLQNYWMVIHPPVLFLGFASTIIPFAFAIAGLWKKDHSWITKALPWTSFSAAVLGIGIMMGAAWAYESLSFGGYWAWDPVENASLVPWLTLIAGLHTNLIYKSTGYSLRSTYFFYIISFSLILYSTFLTRSGILGDTSVHAFTDLGMNTQLLIFLFIFLIPALVLYVVRYNHIPTIVKEEQTYSREFWMFIGALVFFLAGLVIIAKTSVPVFNKVFGTNIAPPEDPEFAYNQIQIFVAIVVGLLTGFGQYLKYKSTDKAFLVKRMLWPTVVAVVITLCIGIFGNINYNKAGIGFLTAIHLAIFAAVYALVANAAYIFIALKGKLKAAGASVAHVGFAMALVGILISSAKKTVLSWNTTGLAVFKKDKREDPAENITLFKGIATDMGKYHVTYRKDTLSERERKRFFEINFTDKKSGESFNLYPDLIKNNKGAEGFAANPDARHYWYKDIFVYISAFQENTKDTATYRNKQLKVGDTVFYSNGMIVLKEVLKNPASLQTKFEAGEQAMFLNLEILSKEGRKFNAYPGVALKGTDMRFIGDTVINQSMALKFNKVADQTKGLLEIGVKESNSITDLITLKVYEFPMINLLWLGIVLMGVGFVMAIRQRIKAAK